MKLKRINIIEVLIYPHILNPLCCIASVIYLAYVFVFVWWEAKNDGSYVIYRIDKDDFKNRLKDLLMYILSVLINTLWFNKKLTFAYCKYLVEYKWFPYYKKDDWRYKNEKLTSYNRYLRLKKSK